MTPDTWGIPGPAFLAAYLGAIALIAVLATVHRRRLTAGRPEAVNGLGPQEIAYLSGGDRRAVYASLGGLRAAGVISSNPDNTLLPTGPLPAGSTPLDTAVYNATGRRIPARDVTTDQWVVTAVAQLRDGLETMGLAITAAQRRAGRWWVVPGLALVALGITRLVAGVRNDRPIGFLVPSIVVAVVVTVLLGTKRSGVATRAATKKIDALRVQQQYLSPRRNPSYTTYGAPGAAMGVALFGTASLYSMDPGFASAAGIEIQQASSASWGSTSSGDGGSWGTGAGTSCGGGGGSSCGGGGGGGGCGG